MKNIRYYLSALFLDWGVRLIPDDLPRASMHLGLTMGLQTLKAGIDEFEAKKNSVIESAWGGDEEETLH